MFEAGVVDARAGVNQVVDVIQRIKVPDRGDAVLLEELGMEPDDVRRGGVKAYDVHAAGKGLEVGVGAGHFAEPVHHVERILVAIEVGRLEHRAAAGLEVRDAGFTGGSHGRHEIFGEDTGAIDGLETVAEGGTHETDIFFGHCWNSLRNGD